MAIQSARDSLTWRVHLNAPPRTVFEILTTDAGRERFWAEHSRQIGNSVTLTFPDHSTTTLRIERRRPPTLWSVIYFGTPTIFALRHAARGTVLEVRASRVPADDMGELAAGWVSVLLALKAVVNFGDDLRNHRATRSWRRGFVDN